MELSDELAADRQPQAASLDPRVLVAGQAEEGLEHPVEGFGGDARPESETITDQESASAFPVDAHPSSHRRVLQGVGDEVAEDLLAA